MAEPYVEGLSFDQILEIVLMTRQLCVESSLEMLRATVDDLVPAAFQASSSPQGITEYQLQNEILAQVRALSDWIRANSDSIEDSGELQTAVQGLSPIIAAIQALSDRVNQSGSSKFLKAIVETLSLVANNLRWLAYASSKQESVKPRDGPYHNPHYGLSRETKILVERARDELFESDSSDQSNPRSFSDNFSVHSHHSSHSHHSGHSRHSPSNTGGGLGPRGRQAYLSIPPSPAMSTGIDKPMSAPAGISDTRVNLKHNWRQMTRRLHQFSPIHQFSNSKGPLRTPTPTPSSSDSSGNRPSWWKDRLSLTGAQPGWQTFDTNPNMANLGSPGNASKNMTSSDSSGGVWMKKTTGGQLLEASRSFDSTSKLDSSSSSGGLWMKKTGGHGLQASRSHNSLSKVGSSGSSGGIWMKNFGARHQAGAAGGRSPSTHSSHSSSGIWMKSKATGGRSTTPRNIPSQEAHGPPRSSPIAVPEAAEAYDYHRVPTPLDARGRRALLSVPASPTGSTEGSMSLPGQLENSNVRSRHEWHRWTVSPQGATGGRSATPVDVGEEAKEPKRSLAARAMSTIRKIIPKKKSKKDDNKQDDGKQEEEEEE